MIQKVILRNDQKAEISPDMLIFAEQHDIFDTEQRQNDVKKE